MKTKTIPFDIYIPATENRAAIKVETIQVEVIADEHGNELLTPASEALIDKTQARYLGLLAAEDICALRNRLGLSQDQFSDLIGCGKKSLSRWENGHEYPSQLVNTLLRLLNEDLITTSNLRQVRMPIPSVPCNIIQFMDKRSKAPCTYDLETAWNTTEIPELLAM